MTMIIRHDPLREMYPELGTPIRCENGCGFVIDVIDAFFSYKKNDKGDSLLICECCASEEGHIFEENEGHDEGPVCKRKPKKERA